MKIFSFNRTSASSHGKPSPTRMSKMLEPTALAMAIEPRPWRATMTDANRSGTDVPAASNVSATITGGMCSASANTTAISTST